MESREAPLLPCMNAGRVFQVWEFKPLDATANTHLALALITGLIGFCQ